MKNLVVWFSMLAAAGSMAAQERMPVGLADHFGSGSGSTDTVTGTWYLVTELSGFGQTAATLTMVQTGSSISGTAAIVGFGSGTVTGTVLGDTLTFAITEISPCAGTFSGSVALSADKRSANGSFSGSDCDGSWTASVSGVNVSAAGDSTEALAQVTGSWNATIQLGPTQANAKLTLVQEGGGVSGTAAIVQAGSGALVGRVSGSNLFFTIYEVSPCAGFFLGSVTISADNRQASGFFNDTATTEIYTATITGTKQ